MKMIQKMIKRKNEAIISKKKEVKMEAKKNV